VAQVVVLVITARLIQQLVALAHLAKVMRVAQALVFPVALAVAVAVLVQLVKTVQWQTKAVTVVMV
jgi:hypothetical protein